jgi:hypothetical protein
MIVDGNYVLDIIDLRNKIVYRGEKSNFNF